MIRRNGTPAALGGRAAIAAIVALLSAVPVGAPSAFAAAEPVSTPHRTQALPPFYTVPDPLPVGQPGELIASQDLGPVAGGQRVRIMYHSRSIWGADIAVTGLVFVPTAPAPPSGWPILAWAHGTTGTADDCAPSLGGYDPEFLDQWLARGYLVTATDYQGMGTPGIHPYLLGESEGRGVLDSVRAAQQLVNGSGSDEVVLFGHSQGGHAAMFANELAPDYAPDLDVIGTIAAAPASQLVFAYQLIDTSPVVRAAAVMMAAGMSAEYGLALDLILTPEAVNRIGITETGCQSDVAAAYADLSGPETAHTSPGEVPGWRDAFRATEPGYRVGPAPVLMYQGTEDEEVPYIAGQILDAQMCATGQVHSFTTYPGANHSGVLPLAQQQTLDFADARVRGDAFVPTACPLVEPPPTTSVPPVVVTPAFTG